MIGNKVTGEKMGMKPRAKIKSFAIYGTDPTIMLVGQIALQPVKPSQRPE